VGSNKFLCDFFEIFEWFHDFKFCGYHTKVSDLSTQHFCRYKMAATALSAKNRQIGKHHSSYALNFK
jgi:hypothetical protein